MYCCRKIFLFPTIAAPKIWRTRRMPMSPMPGDGVGVIIRPAWKSIRTVLWLVLVTNYITSHSICQAMNRRPKLQISTQWFFIIPASTCTKNFINPASTYIMIFPPYDRKYVMWHSVLVTKVEEPDGFLRRTDYHTTPARDPTILVTLEFWSWCRPKRSVLYIMLYYIDSLYYALGLFIGRWQLILGPENDNIVCPMPIRPITDLNINIDAYYPAFDVSR